MTDQWGAMPASTNIDHRLTLRARGLLALCLGLQSEGRAITRRLVHMIVMQDPPEVVNTTFRELGLAGYARARPDGTLQVSAERVPEWGDELAHVAMLPTVGGEP